ncbi:helix-turn-helix domain-containing protein [Sporosarcina sp. P18a]|uniref:helix-turn-helix domain-containing protein n=1 Tax=Sporosarcina sp. P18a TaxID=2048259 RepID=UPI0018EC5C43|nr:helix-turn-helix domain-containing protein [Sporosarcina sp. P18a]
MHIEDLKEIVQGLNNLKKDFEKKLSANKEWMTLKEGAAYAGVSYNTLMKFRLMGLKVAEIDGVKRISKTEIDNFLIENSF